MQSIRYFVQGLNTEKEINHNLYGNNKKSIVCYTKDWVRLYEFDSISDAYDFVISNGYTNREKGNFFYFIKTACFKLGVCCGFRWQYKEDLIYDNKEFNSTLDKDGYKAGLKCQCIDGIWHLIKDDCITDSEKRSNSSIKIDDYEKIIERINNGDNLADIALEIGLSKDALRKRLNRYLKKTGQKEDDDRNTHGVHCKEFGISFKTLKDAALFLIENGLIKCKNINSTAYKISNALNDSKKAYGYHWVKTESEHKYYNDLTESEKLKLVEKVKRK